MSHSLFSLALTTAVAVTVVLLAAVAADEVTTEPATQPILVVGDPAPPLNVDRWLKGEPVTRFEPGTIYVVEFWATWCGPCIASMPDLTWLQQKYPQVVFIGVDIMEDDPAKVDVFMKKRGDAMGYRVAADVSPGHYAPGPVAHAWLDAADKHGIPYSFVIGRDGRIVLMRHPGSLERVMKSIVDGTYDARADAIDKIYAIWPRLTESLKADDVDLSLSILDELDAVAPEKYDSMRCNLLIQKGDVVGAEALFNAIVAKDQPGEVSPSTADNRMWQRLRILAAKHDAVAANQLATAMAEQYDDRPDGLNELAWQLSGGRGDADMRLLHVDPDVILRIAKRAVEKSDSSDAASLDTLARVYAIRGEFDLAVKTEGRAIECDTDGRNKEAFAKTLANYREKKVE